MTLDEFCHLFKVFLSFRFSIVSGTYTSLDFKCLALSVPDKGKFRKAIRTHDLIKHVVFNFLRQFIYLIVV